MRYVLLIYTNEADRPAWGTPEGDAEAKAYEAFHGEVTRHGLQSGEPLLRVAEAKSVRVRDGKAQVIDGPAVQTPEQLGGYYLVDGRDLDEALELAAKVPGGQVRNDRGAPSARAHLASTDTLSPPVRFWPGTSRPPTPLKDLDGRLRQISAVSKSRASCDTLSKVNNTSQTDQ